MTSIKIAAIPKILALVLIISATTASAGTCLSYGHSCWGAHGKRNSLGDDGVPQESGKESEELHFAKLFGAAGEKNYGSPYAYKIQRHDDPTFVEKYQQREYENYPFAEPTDHLFVSDTGSSDAEDGAHEHLGPQILVSPIDDPMWNTKFRIYQILGEDEGRKGKAE